MDTTYTTTINGDNVTFEFKDCLIHAEGNHAGNIDAIITTKPPIPQNLLLDELHIKVPGSDEYLYIYGYGAVENSLKATFNSSTIVDKKNLPEKVGVYWGPNGEQFIGDINCQPYSEKVEHDLTDEIVATKVPEQKEEQNEISTTETSTKKEVLEKQEKTKPDEVSSSKIKIILIAVILFILIAGVFLLL